MRSSRFDRFDRMSSFRILEVCSGLRKYLVPFLL
jgi:hypothetical protein